MTRLRDHWNQAYTAKAETAVSWFQPVLATSLRLIKDAAPDLHAAVIDIGGGASTLPDSLIDAGYRDVTVLDISETALGRSKARLADAVARVSWQVADITAWMPERTWEVWHDRAVFHFLTEGDAQDKYIATLHAGTSTGSVVILATFAPDGPERCSGLPVQRYSQEDLAKRIGPGFKLLHSENERHVTPGGAAQSFSYVVLKRSS